MLKLIVASFQKMRFDMVVFLMSTRRNFLGRAVTVSAAVSSMLLSKSGVKAAPAADQKARSSATRPLRILILGGTGHIGPYHVEAAIERGHQVAVFSRGKTNVHLPAGVELLTGDRNRDLESIKNRDWDAVLDLATFVPVWVRSLGEALRGHVGHYTFISTVSVYQDPNANRVGTREEDAVQGFHEAVDPYSLTTFGDGQYAPLKVLCEREAETQFPGKALIVRPGCIVGPGDAEGAFTYLPVRMEKGGELLTAGDPLAMVQMIDVRDLAEWVIRMIEKKATGIFNAVGPAMPMGLAEMLGAIRGTMSTSMTLTWVPVQWFARNKFSASPPLFWPSEANNPGQMHMINEKAHAQGLTFRPLSVTCNDTLAWYKSLPKNLQNQAILGFDDDPSALEVSMARERQILEAWHRTQTETS
jgi:2'-hydroxyisoflavone reductase